MANELAYMWTLTLADQSDDYRHVAGLVESFVRQIRAHTRCRVPYVWVLEPHKTGNLHVHLAVDRYLDRRWLVRAWGHGFVFVSGAKSDRSRGKHLGAAGVARYVAKYVTKEVGAGVGAQSYRVAQGFQPEAVQSHAWSLIDAYGRAVAHFDGESPAYVWWSSTDASDDDRAPPCWWATWQPG